MSVLVLPVAAVYAVLYCEFSPVPIIDDFNDLLDFAVELHHTSSFFQRLLLVLTTQTGDYKLIFEHALVALQILFLHHISFSNLLWLGNLLLLPVLFVLWSNTFPASPVWERLILFSPVPYFLFQLNFAENCDWALGSLQNFGVIAFGLLALHLLRFDGRLSFGLACCFGVLSASASSNGFALVFAGSLLLWRRASFRRLTCWVIMFTSFLALYCFDYQFPKQTGHTALGSKALFFLSFLGSAVENMHGRPLPHASVVLGTVLLVSFVYVIWGRSLQDEELFFTAGVCWVLITAAMAAEVRISLGIQLALSVRYKIYCDLVLVFVYLLMASRLRAQGNRLRLQEFCLSCLAIAVLFNLSSDVLGYRFLHKRRANIEAAMRAYERSPTSATPEYLPSAVPSSGELREMERQRIATTKAVSEGLYGLPSL